MKTLVLKTTGTVPIKLCHQRAVRVECYFQGDLSLLNVVEAPRRFGV